MRTQLGRIRWAVRLVLVLGVAASVAANVLHARPNPISQAIAAWPPLALLLTVELISRVPVDRRGVAAVRIAATAAIASIAAWVSYWHMASVASRYGEQGASAYLLPLSVDGLIVVASISLVELAVYIRSVEQRAVPAVAGMVPAGAPNAPAGIASSYSDGDTPTVPASGPVRVPVPRVVDTVAADRAGTSLPVPTGGPVHGEVQSPVEQAADRSAPSLPTTSAPTRMAGPVRLEDGPGTADLSLPADRTEPVRPSAPAGDYSPVRATRTGPVGPRTEPSAPDRGGKDLPSPQVTPIVPADGPARSAPDRTDDLSTGADGPDQPKRTATDSEIRTIIEEMDEANRTKLRAALAERGLRAPNERLGPFLAAKRTGGPVRTNGHNVLGASRE